MSNNEQKLNNILKELDECIISVINTSKNYPDNDTKLLLVAKQLEYTLSYYSKKMNELQNDIVKKYICEKELDDTFTN